MKAVRRRQKAARAAFRQAAAGYPEWATLELEREFENTLRFQWAKLGDAAEDLGRAIAAALVGRR